MRLFLSRFAKTVSLFMMSVALLLSLSVDVFSSEDLSTSNFGFYQFIYDTPPRYQRIGSFSYALTSSVTIDDYNPNLETYFGTRSYIPSDQIPSDRNYIQFSIVFSLAASNPIPEDLRDKFFGYILCCKYPSPRESIAYDSLYEIKPYSVDTQVNAIGTTAVLNLMFTKQQFFDNSVTSSGRTYFFLFPQISTSFMRHYLGSSSNIGMVVFNKVSWSDTSDIVPIDEQTLFLLGQISEKLDSIDSGISSIDSSINADLVDQSDLYAIDSSIADHSAADAAVNDALQDILDMVVYDSDGNPIPLTFDSGYIQNLATLYNFDLSGFAVTNASSIFRHTLAGYITQFGAFIFFPLVLGIIGALMGRPSGA